jgi:hypothetical protein
LDLIIDREGGGMRTVLGLPAQCLERMVMTLKNIAYSGAEGSFIFTSGRNTVEEVVKDGDTRLVWVGNARARRNHGFYVENCFVV